MICSLYARAISLAGHSVFCTYRRKNYHGQFEDRHVCSICAFSNYDQIMLLHYFKSRATIPKMKDHIIVLIASLLILSLSVKANKGGAEEEILRR